MGNGSWEKAESFGEKPIEYRHCPPQIPREMSLNLIVICAEATHLSYSAAHDKNFYFEKPQLLLFRITSKCFSARILPNLPSTEDLLYPFCIQSPQIVNFVGINLNFIGLSNKNTYQKLKRRLTSLSLPQISLYYTAKYVSVYHIKPSSRTKCIQCVMKMRGPEVSFFFTRFKQSTKILRLTNAFCHFTKRLRCFRLCNLIKY